MSDGNSHPHESLSSFNPTLEARHTIFLRLESLHRRQSSEIIYKHPQVPIIGELELEALWSVFPFEQLDGMRLPC